MRKSILLSIGLSVALLAKTVHTEGKTWQFAEKNAVQELQEIAERDKDIVYARMETAKKEAIEKVKNYKAPNATKLTRATADRVFYPDMTYELDRDITDAQGKLLYPKGFKFNVMDYTGLNGIKIVAFDPTDKEQVNWYTKSGYNKSATDMVLITDGAAYQITEKFDRPIYYLTKPITDRFSLQHTPCVIEQEGRRIKVTEIDPTKRPKDTNATKAQ